MDACGFGVVGEMDGGVLSDCHRMWALSSVLMVPYRLLIHNFYIE